MKNNNIVWITGASSGIGYETALQLSKQNFKLILSARNESELEKLAALCIKNGSEAKVLKLDLEHIENPELLVNTAWNFYNKIDVFFSNGGVSQRGTAAETDISVVKRLMEINFFGSISITRYLLPKMIEAGNGHFVVNSSLAGLMGFHLRSAYAASKHALHGYYEALALENFNNNIKVSMICPGRIKTNISFNSLTANGNKHGEMDHGQENGLSVASCVSQIIKTFDSKPRIKLIGKFDKYIIYIKRFWPWLYFKICLKLNPTK